MAWPQTTVTAQPAASIPGMLANMSVVRNIETGKALVAVDFGRFVSHVTGSPDFACQPPVDAAAITDLFFGFVMADTSRQMNPSVNGQYAIGDEVPVITCGQFWVESIEAVTAIDADVYVVHTAGANRGKVGFGAAAGKALLTGAKFKSTSAAAGLVQVEYFPL